MRPAALLLTLGLCCSGCAPLMQVADTVRYESGYRWNEIQLDFRERRLARRGWSDFLNSTHDRTPVSRELKAGFLAGYEGFLHRGSGEPPAVPPRRYWGSGSPFADERSAEWYRGFQLGAIAAEASGLRNRFVVPVSPVAPRPMPLIVGIQTEPHLEVLDSGAAELEELPPTEGSAPGRLPKADQGAAPPTHGPHAPEAGNAAPRPSAPEIPLHEMPTWDFKLLDPGSAAPHEAEVLKRDHWPDSPTNLSATEDFVQPPSETEGLTADFISHILSGTGRDSR